MAWEGNRFPLTSVCHWFLASSGYFLVSNIISHTAGSVASTSTFCKKMSPRIEKNRKHLATFIVAILGTTILLLVNQVWAFPSQVVAITIWVFPAILVARSAVIEVGVRRSANGLEKNLDRVGSRFAEKHLGLVSLPQESIGDVATRAEKKDAEQGADGQSTTAVKSKS
jgi:MFS superfamily sulfate permease-like transporter